MRRVPLLLLMFAALASGYARSQEHATISDSDGLPPATSAAPLDVPVPVPEPLGPGTLFDPAFLNAYPDFHCSDWACCKQWWCSTWYTRVELLTLSRNYTPSNAVIVSTGGTPLLTGNDIGFKLGPGLSAMLGHRLDGQSAVELIYFGTNQWNLDRTFALANTVEVTLRSQFNNAEVNYLYDLPNVSLLAGFRYLNLTEQLVINNNAVGSFADRVGNNFAGGQLGVRSASYWRGFDVEATAKAGMYGNQASVGQETKTPAGVLVNGLSVTNATLAFIGDLNLSAMYPLTRGIRARAGYNLLYASGVGLAVHQPNFLTMGTTARHVDQGGDLFLHGFNVGMEAIW